jgi:hypothetical protein
MSRLACRIAQMPLAQQCRDRFHTLHPRPPSTPPAYATSNSVALLDVMLAALIHRFAYLLALQKQVDQTKLSCINVKLVDCSNLQQEERDVF